MEHRHRAAFESLSEEWAEYLSPAKEHPSRALFSFANPKTHPDVAANSVAAQFAIWNQPQKSQKGRGTIHDFLEVYFESNARLSHLALKHLSESGARMTRFKREGGSQKRTPAETKGEADR